MSHLEPLHIKASLNNHIVNRILVDGRADISLPAKRMLARVGKNEHDIIRTNTAMNDYSGSSTPEKGLVSLIVKMHVDFKVYNDNIKPIEVDREF
ncbi:hypothetical protein PIB30_025257 [Stylosanthes scabra]|uniref:Uncharacterized protein n=1 Tax=Stylosanthes scabra TaxID=79078 RepID=A0ABU6T9N3_9FABA|nr:hypothetical protein [Stylosanthes scabra]